MKISYKGVTGITLEYITPLLIQNAHGVGCYERQR